MKSTLLSLTIGLVLSVFVIGTSSDSHADPTIHQKISAPIFKEIILQIEDLNEKNLSEIRKNIEISGGLTFKGYCQKLKIIMYVVDTDLHPDYSFLNTAFMNMSMGYVIKEGASILQVQNECDIDPLSIPTNSQD